MVADCHCGFSLYTRSPLSFSSLPFSSRSPSRRSRPLKVMAWLLGGMLLLATLGLALGGLPEDDNVRIELVAD